MMAVAAFGREEAILPEAQFGAVVPGVKGEGEEEKESPFAALAGLKGKLKP